VKKFQLSAPRGIELSLSERQSVSLSNQMVVNNLFVSLIFEVRRLNNAGETWSGRMIAGRILAKIRSMKLSRVSDATFGWVKYAAQSILRLID
jgi:hypothetical protein